jgi:predicted RNA-binding Zn-ribbon protein involved in translation (DUF1610 family)
MDLSVECPSCGAKRGQECRSDTLDKLVCFGRRLTWLLKTEEMHQMDLSVECPSCGAKRGQECRSDTLDKLVCFGRRLTWLLPKIEKNLS